MKMKMWKMFSFLLLLVLLLIYLYFEFLLRKETKWRTEKCSKVKKIAFLKTHKCASSTVQNILMRFGVNNDLNFVLPSRGNYLGR